MSAGPAPGDVLIDTRDGRHFVSLVPDRSQVSFKSLSQAREFAERWAHDHPGASIWHRAKGHTQLMALADTPKPTEASRAKAG